ncbi:MAG: formate dehydrogenase accessory protein FdhE [Candidatus Bathyarchaeota archaeon]|nr:MAG: formate dehydrogenase accessory protein FdhE [Candidatus Bathyarchaeota archaeon]
MGNPSIQEQLKTISALLPQHEDLQDSLKIQKKILQIQLEIDNTPTKGTTINWNDQTTIITLQQKSFEAKKPIIHFLDQSIFDLEALFPISKKIVYVFIEQNINEKGLKKLLDFMENEKINLFNLIEATLRENIIFIRKIAEKLDVQPALLLYIVSVLIQPCVEEIARKIDSSLLGKWWQASCPVCGRIPIIAKLRHRKRYLACVFCGTEYLSDRFFCVHCENKDPYTLKYLSIEAKPAFQIDFCTKCKHYIKVIDEAKLKETIPKGLEDILTLNLDYVAKNANLIRD